MGAQGHTTIDFGAFPGGSDASVAIAGQAGILAASDVDAWLRGEASADHSSDEHLVETIQVIAMDITAGTGFTIKAMNTSQLNEPVYPPLHETSLFTSQTGSMTPKQASPGVGGSGGGGQGTRIYGVWNVSWVWN